jgi:hypothetical protein
MPNITLAMPDPRNEDAKARNAIRLIRVVMAAGVVLPLVLFWLLR